MVKIRSQRVFLTEVENHLRAVTGVTGAAAAARVEREETVICGVVTTGPIVQHTRSVRRSLADWLPDFMLLQEIMVVDEIPVLPGGKVEYRSLTERVPALLPTPMVRELQEREHCRLAALWHSNMGPGAHDPRADFPVLGGVSLKLMELSLAVEREFGRPIPREVLLSDPTLDGLAVSVGLATQLAAYATRTFIFRTSRRSSLTSPLVVERAVSPASRLFPASRNSLDQL